MSGGKNMNRLTEKILHWAKERGLDKADPNKQMLKLIEEIGEIASGMARSDMNEVKDGIGDSIVVLTILAEQLGTSTQECTHMAYEEIKDRRGKMVDGVFVKESDLK